MMVEKTGKRRPAREQDNMIIEALRGMGGQPVSAYELIDQLRDKAVLAPQTVYRSLDRLIADGQAHRLESLNAFIACRHPSHRVQRSGRRELSCGVGQEGQVWCPPDDLGAARTLQGLRENCSA